MRQIIRKCEFFVAFEKWSVIKGISIIKQFWQILQISQERTGFTFRIYEPSSHRFPKFRNWLIAEILDENHEVDIAVGFNDFKDMKELFESEK